MREKPETPLVRKNETGGVCAGSASDRTHQEVGLPTAVTCELLREELSHRDTVSVGGLRIKASRDDVEKELPTPLKLGLKVEPLEGSALEADAHCVGLGG
jgi:hypothetical protein